MLQQKFQSKRQIFVEAIEIQSPDDRLRFVSQACGEDVQLRDEVNALLRAYDPQSEFMQGTAPEHLLVLLDEPVAARQFALEGSMIGNYQLLEEIGSGGMGTVYRAQQLKPVERRVAIKIVKAGMDTREVIARFQAERQALAVMNHPNIAQVLDAGATETGRPYFVMEFVNGGPIADFCNAQQLSIRERLQLMVTVCDAVQHAHRKGILHQDLKSSNVLVEMRDGGPTIKVIDFGIQKSIGQDDVANSFATAIHQLVGTPMSMSPEQALGGRRCVDTRSDVYSLGVLLYELLTGQTAFDKNLFTNAGFDDVRHIIIEQQPPLPSRRAAVIRAEDPTTFEEICRQRRISEDRLTFELKGELDWIVMKSIHKVASQRYDSPHALAMDLERYLKGDAVVAGRPSKRYLLRKIIARHRWSVLFFFSVATTMLLGTVISLHQAGIARDARRAADGYLAKSQQEEARYRKLAWNSTIRQAYSNWNGGRLAEAEDLLTFLRQSDPDAERFPEWQLLKNEIGRSYRRILQLSQPLNEVRSIPGRDLIAAAGDDGNIYLVSRITGETQAVIRTGISSLHALAVSADGTMIAAGGVTEPQSDTAKARIFDVATQALIAEMPGQPTTIESLEFSADGQWLASGCRYTEVAIFEIDTGQLVASLPTARRNLWLTRSLDGRQLAAQQENDSVVLTEFRPPFTSHTLKTPIPLMQSVWMPQSGRLIGFLKGGSDVYAFDIFEDRTICMLQGTPKARQFAFSTDASMIVGGLDNGEVIHWSAGEFRGTDDESTNQQNAADVSLSQPPPEVAESWRRKISNSPITSLEIDDDSVFATSYGGDLVQLKLTLSSDAQYRDNLDASAVNWNTEGSSLIVGSVDGSVYRADISSELPEQSGHSSSATTDIGGFHSIDVVCSWRPLSPKHSGPITSVAMSGSHGCEAWGSIFPFAISIRQDGQVRRLPLDDVVSVLDVEGELECMTFSPDSASLAWANMRHVFWCDIKDSDARIQHAELPGLASCLAWSPDGRSIFVGGNFSSIVRLDRMTGDVTVVANIGIETESIALTNNGQTICSGHRDGSIRFTDLLGSPSKTLFLHQTPVRSISISHEGRLGISSDDHGTMALWFPDSMEEIGTLGHAGNKLTHENVTITQSAFSQDGLHLFTAHHEASKGIVIQRRRLKADSN